MAIETLLYKIIGSAASFVPVFGITAAIVDYVAAGVLKVKGIRNRASKRQGKTAN